MNIKVWINKIRSYWPHKKHTLPFFMIFHFHPASQSPQTAPVFIVLHGCKQNIDDLRMGARWLEYSKKYNFSLLFPEQLTLNNPLKCWNWFLDFEQKKSSFNSSAEILTKINSLIRTKQISEKSPLYLVGLSAGSALAHTLASCYPEKFSGVGLHSGPSYASQTLNLFQLSINPSYYSDKLIKTMKIKPTKSMSKVTHNQCQPSDFQGPLMVIQGLNDEVVHPSYETTIQNLHFQNSTTVRRKVITQEKHYQRILYSDENKSSQSVLINNFPHAWSGGLSGYNYISESGPNSTEIMVEYFLNKD